MTRWVDDPLTVASGIALLNLIAMSWLRFDRPMLVVLLALAMTLALFFVRPSYRSGLAWIVVAVFGLAPAAQVVTSHIPNAEPYPIVDLAPREASSATGVVEDFLFVVVDGYPALSLADGWFGHSPGRVTRALESLGFTVAQTAYTQMTFTALSVPSMLELQPVAEPGSNSYGNRSSVFTITRGDSLVSSSLRSAGFEYTHIESGWEGDTCASADRCLQGPLFDEVLWRLAETSIFYESALHNFGGFTRAGTKTTIEGLRSIQSDFGDGEHDYVFAHLMLPHEPNVVDADCNPVPPGSDRDQIEAQLICVDKMLAEIAQMADGSTAIVIAGDHGSHSLAQRFIPAEDWTDAQIAERFGTFLAYRYPADCPSPAKPINLEAVRVAVACTIDIVLPPNHGRFLIGADNPEWVEPTRMQEIQEEMVAGSIRP